MPLLDQSVEAWVKALQDDVELDVDASTGALVFSPYDVCSNFDVWGNLVFGDAGSAHPLEVDVWQLIWPQGYNAIRGRAGLPIGHAVGTIGEAPTGLLHVVALADEGHRYRLVDVAGNVFDTAVVEGDELQFEISFMAIAN